LIWGSIAITEPVLIPMLEQAYYDCIPFLADSSTRFSDQFLVLYATACPRLRSLGGWDSVLSICKLASLGEIITDKRKPTEVGFNGMVAYGERVAKVHDGVIEIEQRHATCNGFGNQGPAWSVVLQWIKSDIVQRAEDVCTAADSEFQKLVEACVGKFSDNQQTWDEQRTLIENATDGFDKEGLIRIAKSRGAKDLRSSFDAACKGKNNVEAIAASLEGSAGSMVPWKETMDTIIDKFVQTEEMKPVLQAISSCVVSTVIFVDGEPDIALLF